MYVTPSTFKSWKTLCEFFSKALFLVLTIYDEHEETKAEWPDYKYQLTITYYLSEYT